MMDADLKKKNFELWSQICVTPDGWAENTRLNGRNIKTADVQLLKKWATELFGPFGIGWGTENETYREIIVPEMELGMIVYSGTMFINYGGVTGRFGITSACKFLYRTQGNNSRIIFDDEATKKAQSNAISKGLSNLGMCSDIYEGKFDDDKWKHREALESEKSEKKPKPASKEKPGDQAGQAESHEEAKPTEPPLEEMPIHELVTKYKNAFASTQTFLKVSERELGDLLFERGLPRDRDWKRPEFIQVIKVLHDLYLAELKRRGGPGK